MEQYKPKLGWQDSMAWGLFLIVVYLLLAVAPLFFAWMDAPASDRPILVEIALAAAMLGFSLLCLQVLLAGRFKTVDRPFGLDVLMKFHKAMAVVAGCLLLSHPVLLAVGHQSWHLFTFDTSWQVNWGKAALFLVVLGVLFAMFFTKFGVDYNLWRFGHKGMIFVVIFGFIHGFYIGPDLQGGLTRFWWIAAAAIAVLIFAYRNLLVPVWLRRRFKVTDISSETHDTYSLTFEPEDGNPIICNPGQFMFLKLIRPGRRSELHPFTISASPLNEKQLQATIKQSGNFTNSIDQTKPGDVGKIEAPFGRFSYVYHDPAKILFIAGGVGITPIMSMVRCLRDTHDKRSVCLLYGNNTEKDIIFRQEIDALPEQFKTVHVLANAGEDWQGEQGYITADLIKKHAGDMINDAHVYLCGPLVMMDNVISALQGLGVDDKRIHFERFTL